MRAPGRRIRRSFGHRTSSKQPVNPGEFGLTPTSTGRWLLVVIFIEAGAAVSIRMPLVFGMDPWAGFDGPTWLLDLLALLIVPLVVVAAWRLMRQQHRERAQASRTSGLMDVMLHTSREWLWAVDSDGRFTFCGPACRALTGYEPSELLGRHLSLVIDPNDLSDALQNRKTGERGDSSWAGLVTVCRHRDGSRVLVEVSGRPLRDREGRQKGFEGTSRALDAERTRALATEEVRARIEAMLADRTLLTAFQPIRSLETGEVIGAEALTRFISSEGISPEVWFVEAASVGLEADLEFLALRTALATATELPPDLYVAVNLSPGACLDPRLTTVIQDSAIPACRIVLEVTERHEVTDYAQLADVLSLLRGSGVRIAIDDAGAGFASMRHILQLKPDLIKLDRDIIAGIDTDPGQRALGAAMVGFAKETGADLVAEGIETEAELTAVTKLGMSAGQGYLLGRPSVRPETWTQWRGTPPNDRWTQNSTRPLSAD
jgi:PAS domain S-box-containing protein